MRRALVLVMLAGGCAQPSRPARVSTAPTAAETGFQLADAVSGQPVDPPVLNAVSLNVNRKGEVTPPFDREGDSDTLSDLDSITSYIRRRADVERMETGNDRPAALPILRVDRETPFEKMYPVLRACQQAGYEQYQLRVRRSADGDETQVTLKIPCLIDGPVPCFDPTAEPPRSFTVRVSTNDSGQIIEQSFREDGSPDDAWECLGANLATYEAKIREVGAVKLAKSPQPRLTLELADKLPHKTVVRLLDVALQAGFGDVWLTPIDSTKR